MRFLYNLAAILIVTIIIPIFMLRATRERGFVERIKQSFGFYPQDTIDKVAGKNAIWVHAASVGEIVATSPLVREFRKKFPDSPILVSVVTTGGYEMAHRIIKDADAIIYFPLDLPFLASRVVGRIRPRVFLPVETELWPNFLKKAKQLDVPVTTMSFIVVLDCIDRLRTTAVVPGSMVILTGFMPTYEKRTTVRLVGMSM